MRDFTLAYFSARVWKGKSKLPEMLLPMVGTVPAAGAALQGGQGSQRAPCTAGWGSQGNSVSRWAAPVECRARVQPAQGREWDVGVILHGQQGISRCTARDRQ